MDISQRFKVMEASSVRKLSIYADEAKEKGKKVYHLNIGQPDLATPELYFEKIRSFNEPATEYMPSLGIPALIDSIQAYYADFGIHYNKEQIAVTSGGTEALLFTFLAIANEGDEILLPEPFYSNYTTFFTISGAICIPVTTYAENGFHFSEGDLTSKITKRSKAILISNPGNPTGAVLSMDEIKMVAKIAKEYDLYIIADEVYREFVFDGREVGSFGFLPDIEDRLIIIDSVSKRFNACGARIGMLLTKNKDLFSVITKLCQGRLACSTIEQYGAVGLYEAGKRYITDARDQYQERRDIIYGLLKQVPGVVCRKPEGAFYLIAKLPIDDVDDFLTWLLTSFDIDGETVMAAPAEGFYKTRELGKNELRIAYVLEEEPLTKAMRILTEGLKRYMVLNNINLV
ncbi:MAG TPA: pyridoxal phosphate-dependent aminotransferase [Anaerovoracaceae bacterium]|nr:pyridoxal phosphate-dependent aminotransferase [Anaerovoracaceae bacterium]